MHKHRLTSDQLRFCKPLTLVLFLSPQPLLSIFWYFFLLNFLGVVLGFGFVDVSLEEELAEEHEVAEVHERGPEDVLEV